MQYPSQVKKVPISEIHINPKLQRREKLCEETIIKYVEAEAERGEKFPPIKVISNSSGYYVLDGHHRLKKDIHFNKEEIEAEVIDCNEREAELLSLGLNDDNGLPRTNADKRKCVQAVFEDAEWSQWSDKVIGDHCKVSDRYVAKIRKELNPSSNGSEIREIKTTRNGKELTMKINTNGGKRATRNQAYVPTPQGTSNVFEVDHDESQPPKLKPSDILNQPRNMIEKIRSLSGLLKDFKTDKEAIAKIGADYKAPLNELAATVIDLLREINCSQIQD